MTAVSSVRPAILCPMGGLANRIRAIDSALTLCRRFDRPLEIVWMRDARQINARFSDLFEPPGQPGVRLREASFFDRLRYAPPVWRRNAKVPFLWQFARFGISERRLSVSRGFALQRAGAVPPQFARRARTVFLHVWWQIVSPEDHYAFFRPIPPLRAEIQTLTAAFPSRTVGVHVRRGDHAQATRLSPVEAFESRMDSLLDSGEADAFFLATDDPAVRKHFGLRYGSRLFSRGGSSNRATLAGMRGAVVDLWTLSHCTSLLASAGSTFAPTAASLGGIPCETVLSPSP